MSLRDKGIYVRCVSLPLHIKGVTLPNNDSTFDIYINSLLSDNDKQSALQHELRHIDLDHFYIVECIGLSEKKANL